MSKPAPDRSSLRFLLRAGTREEHDGLDRSFAALLPPRDRAVYHHFIRMNHAAHEAVETWLADGPLIAWLPEWPSWSRLDDLRSDMEHMGLEIVCRPRFLPGASALPQSVGVAYVLEGSRLGAVYIHREMIRHAIMDHWPQDSFAYLAKSGEGRHFTTLATRMADLDFSPEEQALCIEAARATFGYFETLRQLTGQPADKVTETA